MKIYLGHTPEQAPARRALRERALALHTSLAGSRPLYTLLNARQNDVSIDLLVMSETALLVGQYVPAPAPLAEQEAHLDMLRRARDAVLARMRHAMPQLSRTEPPFHRTIGALLFERSPAEHVLLDVDDHRQSLKLTALDELPALLRIARTGMSGSEADARTVMSGVFGGRLWHDGDHFLFELAHAPYHLRVLNGEQTSRILPLLEGTNIIGRRRVPIQSEYRLTVSGDSSMSNDHALLLCPPDGRVILRDTSTNGTWVTPPGGPEERIARIERTIAPGTILRMGETRLLLERASVTQNL